MQKSTEVTDTRTLWCVRQAPRAAARSAGPVNAARRMGETELLRQTKKCRDYQEASAKIFDENVETFSMRNRVSRVQDSPAVPGAQGE